MKNNVASYSVGICEAIVELYGKEEIGKVLVRSAGISANKKARKLIDSEIPFHIGLGKALESMLREFDTTNFSSQEEENGFRVDNPECGCLSPFSEYQQDTFTQEEIRKYTCMRCIVGYRKAARILGSNFKGGLTEEGCYMFFEKGEKRE